MSLDVGDIAAHFEIEGDFLRAHPLERGHIHDTFVATYRTRRGERRYLHQRMNSHVFRDPPAVVENIVKVTHHVRHKLAERNLSDLKRRVLTLIPSRDGPAWYRDATGQYWRTYIFVENTRVVETPTSLAEARETARAFGDFQTLVADLPPQRLVETIPDFHKTPARLEALRAVVEKDEKNRAATAREEIRAIEGQSSLVPRLWELHETGRVPLRIVHNDTKINNLLFDADTGEGICVVDLDTVMPGLSLYDFGDMVRAGISATAEDERDPDLLDLRLDVFASLVRGYLSATLTFLKPAETSHLVLAAQITTLENAIRFLTDHLDGDRYFKVERPHQNLDRCRRHLHLCANMQRHEDEMQRIVEDEVSRCRDDSPAR